MNCYRGCWKQFHENKRMLIINKSALLSILSLNLKILNETFLQCVGVDTDDDEDRVGIITVTVSQIMHHWFIKCWDFDMFKFVK